MYLPFRASWQMVIRPSIPVPPPPLRFRTAGFPQYGSKPAVSRALRRLPAALTRPQWLSRPCAFYSVVGLVARRHSRLLTPHTGPVALGSASGFAVRQPHRLLWPHPSFCAASPVSFFISGEPVAPQKVPTFICQSWLTCRRPYSDGSSDPPTNQITDLAFAHFPEARQPCAPHTGLRVVCVTKLQRSLNAAARQLAGPAPDGTFTTELACPGSLHGQVGYDYRSVRFTPDRTCTGCSVSLVGCTPNEPILN